MSGWRDIATAPRDGTPILVYVPGPPGTVLLVAWSKKDSEKGRPGFRLAYAFAEFVVDDATYWQPVPDAPDPEKMAEEAREDALPPNLRKTAVTVIGPSGEVIGVTHVEPEPFKPRTEGLLHPHVDELFGG